jgi:hypothetical protein
MFRIFTALIIIFFSFRAQAMDWKNYLTQFYKYNTAPANLAELRHEFVVNELQRLTANSPELRLEKVGESVEGRSINRVSFGQGPVSLLLWSQMHGDEPTATAALIALTGFIADNPNDPIVQLIREKLSIHMLVMLNPDGAEYFTRRNVQDIDINRDAQMLQSPEGQILKAQKDLLNPDYGFNLHDMDGREMVGTTRENLIMALMAPPVDYEKGDSDSRKDAKKLVMAIKEVLDEFIPGKVARYKAGYMPRAFGDSMQQWGVRTVLIEAGRDYQRGPHFLAGLNFVALMKAFSTIANGELEKYDTEDYERIPLEGTDLYEIIVRNALIYNGTGIKPFRADIGIRYEGETKFDSSDAYGVIEDFGDLSITRGHEEIAGENLVAVPGFIVSSNGTMDEAGLARKGITSVVVPQQLDDLDAGWQVVMSDSVVPNNVENIRERIKISEIAEFTSIPAKATGQHQLGRIRRGMKADLLVFEQTGTSELDFSKLRYVIKNGRIVYPAR